MIKGWRNDPQWVEHYERKQAFRLAMQIQREQANDRSAQAMAQIVRHRQDSQAPTEEEYVRMLRSRAIS
jgi:hypothetical protein